MIPKSSEHLPTQCWLSDFNELQRFWGEGNFMIAVDPNISHCSRIQRHF
ncbi:hypothetical protein [Rubritalea tangerina]